MLIQGSVGQPSTTSIQPGTTPTLRQGQLGEMVVQSLHADYYETTYRRNMFNSATQAGVTLSAGLATATTGLILTNPTTSTVNLVPNYVNFSVNAGLSQAQPITEKKQSAFSLLSALRQLLSTQFLVHLPI